MSERTPTQITMGASRDGYVRVGALADDGTVWIMNTDAALVNAWVQVPALPPRDAEEGERTYIDTEDQLVRDVGAEIPWHGDTISAEGRRGLLMGALRARVPDAPPMVHRELARYIEAIFRMPARGVQDYLTHLRNHQR